MFWLRNKKSTVTFNFTILSEGLLSGKLALFYHMTSRLGVNEIISCNKIDKPLAVNRLVCYVMTSIITLGKKMKES